MCSGGDAVVVSSMTKEIKRGSAMRYKKRLFGKNWKWGALALHEDSTLAFYQDSDSSTPDMGVRLKEAPEMIAIGQFASHVPTKPEFPDDFDIRTSMAVGSRRSKNVEWIIFESEEVLMDWMKAIGSTLPPPPQPPPQQQQQPPQGGLPSQPYLPAPTAPPPPGYTPRAAPQGYPQQQQPQYPQGGRMAQAPAGGTNTVIIRDREYGGGGGGGMGFGSGFMMGAMAGGMTGWGLGYGFGGPRFGLGFGYGGWGYGGGWGGYHDTDVHIHNEHNTYNNTTNNDNDVTNNYNQDQGDQGEVEAEPLAQDNGMDDGGVGEGLYDDGYGGGYADDYGYDDGGGLDFDGGDFGGDFGGGDFDGGDF